MKMNVSLLDNINHLIKQFQNTFSSPPVSINFVYICVYTENIYKKYL